MGRELKQPDDSNADMIYVPVATFSILCPAIVAVRVWTRLRVGGSVQADDYCVVVALIVSLGSGGIMIAACQYGYGQHASNLTPYNRVQANMWFFICQTTYKWSISLTKCSILFLYLRIFNNIRWLKWASWTLITVVTLFCVGASGASVFQCTPFERAFDKSIPGRCIDISRAWYANASFSIATDIIILLLPMPLVSTLQVPYVQKVALTALFAIGIFVIFTSCMRMTTLNITATTSDVTFDVASTMWSIIEMNVAIICACLPMVRTFIVRLFLRKDFVETRNDSLSRRAAVGESGSEAYILGHNRHLNVYGGAQGDVTASPSPDLRRTSGIQKTVQFRVEY